MGDVHAETGTVKGRRLPGRAPSVDGLGSAPASFGLDPGLGGTEQGSSLAFGPQTLLWLQGAAGNAAVGRLVQSLRPGERGAADGPAPVARMTSDRMAAGGGAVIQRIADKPQEHPTLRWGNHQPEVGELQERLNEQQVATPPLVVDDWFGPLTNAAVIEFQGRHGLQVDGVAGIRTWGVLDALKAQGIAGPTRTVLDEMAPVDTTKQMAVEKVLHPGSDPLPMAGIGPGGDYEQAIGNALDNFYDMVMAGTVATPATDMDHAKRVGECAQAEVERFFGTEITMASRKPTGAWHPGSSAMNLSDAGLQNPSDGEVVSWTTGMMDNSDSPAYRVGTEHHYNDLRPKPDRIEHDRVRDVWLSQRDGRRKAREIIKVWGLATDSKATQVGLRNYRFQDRAGMWDLFASLIHECLHLVTHPNYDDVSVSIGGAGDDVLTEGMTDHMTFEVWPAVRPRIATDPLLRSTVEGPFLSPVLDPADYAAGGEIDSRVTNHAYASMARADTIVGTVGEPNARAAYFMGHVEALGIGPQSGHDLSLEGLAGWSADAARPDEYVVPDGGQKVGEIKRLTGSEDVFNRMDEPLEDPAEQIDGGERLTVPGLRWHTTIKEDTRGQVANQHGILQTDLERANKMTHQDPGTPLSPGKPLMIPVPQ